MLDCCPHCQAIRLSSSGLRNFIRFGFFRRSSDGRRLQRFCCLRCKKTFSHATESVCFGQKKRHKNFQILKQVSSGTSYRRTAMILCIDRKTVARKIRFLGVVCDLRNRQANLLRAKETQFEFDEQETFQHTKCQPISIFWAVTKRRRILHFQVAPMPAKGMLSRFAQKKYGRRRDGRPAARRRFFRQLAPLIVENAIAKSDSNPHYVNDLKTILPNVTHIQIKGKRGAV